MFKKIGQWFQEKAQELASYVSGAFKFIRSHPVLTALVVGGAESFSASAQVTNTPAGVITTLTSNAASAFDTMFSIKLAVLAIAIVVFFVRMGMKNRA